MQTEDLLSFEICQDGAAQRSGSVSRCNLSVAGEAQESSAHIQFLKL